jgi:hypothetical protein
MSWLSDLSATGRANCRASANLGLAIGAQWKQQPIELGAGGGEEEVALVALGVAHGKARAGGPHEAGCSGRWPACPPQLTRCQQLVELDRWLHTIHGSALAGDIVVGERLHHRRLEALLVVENVVRNPQPICDPARIGDILPGTQELRRPIIHRGRAAG